MAVDKPQLEPGLLERLYPDELGELDEAERRALLDAAGLSADRAKELEDLDTMLGLIRAEDLVEEVPATVHASIMDAARAHHSAPAAASPHSRAGAAAARKPRVPESEHPHAPGGAKPFWARMPIDTARQVALAATVLLVAGMAFVMTRPTPDERFEQASSAVVSEVTFDGPPQAATPPAPEAGAPAMAELAEKEEASDEQGTPEGFGRGESELALNTEYEQEPSPKGLAAPSYRGRAADALPAERKREIADKTAKPKKSASRGAAKPAPAPRAKSAPSAPAKRGGSEQVIDIFADNMAAPASTSEKSAEDAEEIAMLETDSARAGGAASLGAADSDAPPMAAESKKDAPEPSEIDAIAESFTSGNYGETTTRVDAFLGEPNASAQDKARAMEFKARAQEASGDPSGALDTYEQLRQRYSGYKSSAIAAEIARLDTQLNSRPMRRARERAAPASKSKMDSSEPRPASIDAVE